MRILVVLILASVLAVEGTGVAPEIMERRLFKEVVENPENYLTHNDLVGRLNVLNFIYKNNEENQASDKDRKLVFDLIGITQIQTCNSNNELTLNNLLEENYKNKNLAAFIMKYRDAFRERCWDKLHPSETKPDQKNELDRKEETPKQEETDKKEEIVQMVETDQRKEQSVSDKDITTECDEIIAQLLKDLKPNVKTATVEPSIKQRLPSLFNQCKDEMVRKFIASRDLTETNIRHGLGFAFDNIKKSLSGTYRPFYSRQALVRATFGFMQLLIPFSEDAKALKPGMSQIEFEKIYKKYIEVFYTDFNEEFKKISRLFLAQTENDHGFYNSFDYKMQYWIVVSSIMYDIVDPTLRIKEGVYEIVRNAKPKQQQPPKPFFWPF